MSKDSQEKKIFRIHKISAAGGEKKNWIYGSRRRREKPRAAEENPSHAVAIPIEKIY